MIHDVTTLLSLLLTPLTIIMAIAVVVLWLPSTKKAFFAEHKAELQWLLIGVSIGFLGSAVDNLYWGIAWSADYLNHPSASELFKNGVYANLPFRQVATLAAAFCHMRAAIETDSKTFRLIIGSGWLFGITLTAGLYWGAS